MCITELIHQLLQWLRSVCNRPIIRGRAKADAMHTYRDRYMHTYQNL